MAANLYELVQRLEQTEPEYLALSTANTDDEFDAALNPLLAKAIDHMRRDFRTGVHKVTFQPHFSTNAPSIRVGG